MVKMNVGDLLQFKYKVLAVNQASGITEILGTVDVLGNGSEDDQSIIKIELLSVDCPNGAPCSPNVDCSPCTPMQCVPCVPQPNQPCQPCSDSGCVGGSQHPNMPK
jgi:hypothetical protein